MGMSQIRIVRYSQAKDGNGDLVTTSSYVYLGYAEVEELTGSRDFRDMPVNTKVVRFTLRNRPAIVPKLSDVVEYWGRKHTVQNVVNVDEKRFKYQITATSV